MWMYAAERWNLAAERWNLAAERWKSAEDNAQHAGERWPARSRTRAVRRRTVAGVGEGPAGRCGTGVARGRSVNLSGPIKRNAFNEVLCGAGPLLPLLYIEGARRSDPRVRCQRWCRQ
jgi:hypothetical protein